MSAEMLTYAALGTRLKISPEAARSLAKRLRLPRSLSQDGKAVVSIDLSEIRHTPRPSGAHGAGNIELKAKIQTLQAEIAQLEARAVSHRADFERERERADRLMAELLKTTAETTSAKDATARLEAEVAALRICGRGGNSVEADNPADVCRQAASRVRYRASALAEEDRRAHAGNVS